MSNLTPHVFNDISIRTTEINGQIWFVAADVCKAIELSNVTKALQALDDDEHTLTTIQGLSRGNEQANIINESGLYSLILRSRKAEAKRFKKWVTAEVLPSIRKTGSYQAPQMTEDQLMHWQWTSKHYSGKIGHDQAEMLIFLMRRWIEKSGLQQQTAYHNFHTHMGVGRTDYILRQDFKKAMTYLHLKTGQINHGATDYPPTTTTVAVATRKPATTNPSYCLNDREWHALQRILHHYDNLNTLLKELHQPLRRLGYTHSADLHDYRQAIKNHCIHLSHLREH